LDGGGIKGLSLLLVLRELMEAIGSQKSGGPTALPFQCFDLVCGSNTGGLIAIMLGRMGMVTYL
jgi:patatin-like phospholipase/acyl hydrolase